MCKEQREELADLCHDQWSGWMKYLFSKCTQLSDGNMVMPKWAVKRWYRQMHTVYDHLSKEEKDSDRKEADKFLESNAFDKQFKKGYVKGIENYGVPPLKKQDDKDE